MATQDKVKLLKCSRKPGWACPCGSDNNWGNRQWCRVCGKEAPTSIRSRQLREHEAASAKEKAGVSTSRARGGGELGDPAFRRRKGALSDTLAPWFGDKLLKLPAVEKLRAQLSNCKRMGLSDAMLSTIQVELDAEVAKAKAEKPLAKQALQEESTLHRLERRVEKDVLDIEAAQENLRLSQEKLSKAEAKKNLDTAELEAARLRWQEKNRELFSERLAPASTAEDLAIHIAWLGEQLEKAKLLAADLAKKPMEVDVQARGPLPLPEAGVANAVPAVGLGGPAASATPIVRGRSAGRRDRTPSESRSRSRGKGTDKEVLKKAMLRARGLGPEEFEKLFEGDVAAEDLLESLGVDQSL